MAYRPLRQPPSPISNIAGPSQAWKDLITQSGYADMVKQLQAAIPGIAAPALESNQNPYGLVLTESPWKTGPGATGRGPSYSRYGTLRQDQKPSVYAYVPTDNPNTPENEGWGGLYGAGKDPLFKAGVSAYPSETNPGTAIGPPASDQSIEQLLINTPNYETEFARFLPDRSAMLDLANAYSGSIPNKPFWTYQTAIPAINNPNAWGGAESLTERSPALGDPIEQVASYAGKTGPIDYGGGATIPGSTWDQYTPWAWQFNKDRPSTAANWWNSLFNDPNAAYQNDPTGQTGTGQVLGYGGGGGGGGGTQPPSQNTVFGASGSGTKPSTFIPPQHSFFGGFPGGGGLPGRQRSEGGETIGRDRPVTSGFSSLQPSTMTARRGPTQQQQGRRKPFLGV